MRTLTKDELMHDKNLTLKIAEGDVFVYPTDTIYGIGCNAENKDSVAKIRDLKQRQEDPFSVIAPNLSWIFKNCVVGENADEWISKLPGPYTLIFKLKNKDAVAENINPKGDTLGVRIPDHWISDFAEAIDAPIVTTSANVSGNSFMTSPDDLDEGIAKGVRLLVNEGEINGRPSKIVNLTEPDVKVTER